MIQNGFALERIETGEELAWWISVPDRIDIPGTSIVLFAAQPDWSNEEFRIVGKPKELPDPQPTPRLISKATILARLTDQQYDAAFSAMTPRQIERWRTPGSPEVSVDNPDVLAILSAIGADPAIVLAPEVET